MLAVCPGSFDPLTRGHMDVIERTSKFFDDVIVAVAYNTRKPSGWFTGAERVELARDALQGMPHVRVELVDGLLVDFCARVGADAIVKGVRSSADWDSEQTMGLLNRHISGVETLFLMGDPSLSHIASSYVKELALFGADISDFVTPGVERAVRAQAAKRNARFM
ncbi:MAG: pantetheine-phosphate adenylyltransferase [Actinomycetaceae bacterium]|nr:pantetheine-phosphate adenylyltransferase [Actinomycetaceae bacterium]MDY6083314.1 pantetheine-phosphate adenylyltransferase [Actinomycetaceae bacterium]